MSTSRKENSLYKHKYRELLKAIEDIDVIVDKDKMIEKYKAESEVRE